MSEHSLQLDFFTIGDFAHLSSDAVTRSVHLDVPAAALTVATSLQSARQWLCDQQPDLDMECAAELAMQGYFVFKGADIHDSFHIDTAQLVAIDEGFIVRASLDNGICVETDAFTLPI